MADLITNINYEKCAFCGVDLTAAEIAHCKSISFVPCCLKCLPEQQRKLRQCADLMGKMNMK